MSAEILLYAVVAVGLVFWLRNILGTGEEDDKPSVISRQFDKEDNRPEGDVKNQGNIIALNAALDDAGVLLPQHIRIDNKTTENALDDLSEDYPDFDIHHFADGAESAFKIIIEAFAEGDIDTLKNLLTPNVYVTFEEAIKARNAKGETVETEVKSIDKMDITQAIVKDEMLYITVRFTARELCLIKDSEGKIISGDPDKITEMVDVWVFSHDLADGGPEWYLCETRDDEVEDHKTPVPDAGSDKP